MGKINITTCNYNELVEKLLPAACGFCIRAGDCGPEYNQIQFYDKRNEQSCKRFDWCFPISKQSNLE